MSAVRAGGKRTRLSFSDDHALPIRRWGNGSALRDREPQAGTQEERNLPNMAARIAAGSCFDAIQRAKALRTYSGTQGVSNFSRCKRLRFTTNMLPEQGGIVFDPSAAGAADCWEL